jgi:hypothetical protein
MNEDNTGHTLLLPSCHLLGCHVWSLVMSICVTGGEIYCTGTCRDTSPSPSHILLNNTTPKALIDFNCRSCLDILPNAKMHPHLHTKDNAG